MANPGELLGNILKESNVDRITRKRLNSGFAEFLGYYAAIRHFGPNRDEANYRSLDQLTFDELDRFRRMTIEIWNVVIDLYRKDSANDLDEIASVVDIVPFKEIGDRKGSADKT